MKRGNIESAVRKARFMRGNGITYDTGFFNAGVSTHEPFDPDMTWEPKAAFTTLADYYHG
jgi:hypothetical protein